MLYRCMHKFSRHFSVTVNYYCFGAEKKFLHSSLSNYKQYSCKKLFFNYSTMADDGLYLGTSIRGITNEITIPAPWGKIAAKVFGDSKGLPVLCIHGWLDNCNTFDNLLELLPKDRYYVLIDLPGHGKSSPIPIGSFYSVYDFIALVERIRQYFSWPYFSLLGHSLGGNICAIYSGTFPDKVDKLIILDAIGVHIVRQGTDPEVLRSSIESYMKHENEIEKALPGFTYDEAKARLLKANKSLTSHAADILLERGAAKRDDGTYIFVRDYRHKFRNISGINADSGILFMRHIQAETIHVVAKDGPFKFLKQDAEYFNLYERVTKEGFKQCQFHQAVDVPGKHHVHLCDPEIVVDHVSSILNRPIRSRLLPPLNDPSANL